ncbi:MAG: transglutaminase domain-containing protein [Dehalococcoidia bacterium]|nr:transglutaminase domain-containing protein [Dehalococcoidia bacterium]
MVARAPVVRRWLLRCLAVHTGGLIALWVLLVLYPNPLSLPVSVYRVFNPDIDPVAVEPLLEGLPSDPADIEKAILQRISYHYDWEVNGMPWYFPTTETIVERREGDCKARAVILASVFERLEIPYQFNSSLVHVWVEYEGKAETIIENPRAKFYQQDPETGKRLFQLPEINWKVWFDSTREGLWVVMPLVRKVLLVAGIAVLVAVRVVLRRNMSFKY